MTDGGEIVEADVAGFNNHVLRSKKRTGYDEDAAFDEGFDVPVGTTDAELRDPARRQQLILRNSLDQALRQVPAPGQAQISAEARAKPLPINGEATPPETAKPRQRESMIVVGVPGGAIDTGSGKFYPEVGGPGGTPIVVTPTGVRPCVDTGGGMAF